MVAPGQDLLFIGDDATATSLRACLGELRHEPDLDRALASVAEHEPTCVLVDETHAPISRLARVFPSLAVVALVDRDDDAAIARARRAGAHDHLDPRHLDPDGRTPTTVPTSAAAELAARVVEHAIDRAAAATAAAAADQQLARFASKVAHDLRNPLAIATGMLELLERQVGPQLEEEMRQLIDRSVVALRRAGDLALALQQYAAATRAEHVLAPVDLTERSAWAIETSVIAHAGGQVDIADDLPIVVADETAVGRVLRELLTNAVRHAGPDVHVVIAAEEIAEHWRVTVTDDGPGIPAELRERAFAEGERLGATGDGFGLGLTAVRTIVERLGGTVALESAGAPRGAARGPGLRVVIALPVTDVPEPAPDSLGQQVP